MLSRVSEQIAYCLQRARESHDRADRATESTTQQECLDLERRWLMLARSYELGESVGHFAAHVQHRLTVLTPPAPPHPDLPRVTCERCGKRMRLISIAPSEDESHADVTSFECVCGFMCDQTARRPDTAAD
jgi:hypothetical protein